MTTRRKRRNRTGPLDKNVPPFFAIGGGLYHRLAPFKRTARPPIQVRLDPLGKTAADRPGQRLERRVLDPLHRAEAPQEKTGAPGANPFNPRQLAGESALRTNSSMVGHGETMRLVPDP